MGKVVVGLVRSKVEIGKDHDAGRRMFEDLRTPAGMLPSVIPFAKLEAQPLEQGDQAGKEPARRAECMMVMIGPPEPELILSSLLNSSRPVRDSQ